MYEGEGNCGMHAKGRAEGVPSYSRTPGLRFKSIFPASDDFSDAFWDAFSDAFSVDYLKVINEISPRRRT